MKQLAVALALLAAWPGAQAAAQTYPPPPSPQPGDPIYGYRVDRVFPHDPNAFTEGLFYENGHLWESTGLPGHSFVREEDLDTGKPIKQHDLPASDFGEGIVRWRNNLYQLTWQQHFGYVYDPKTITVKGEFHYPGEGWALTRDDRRIYMSDGTSELRVLDPATMAETGRIHVTDQGRPVPDLNELEWVKGQIYANIWQTPYIVRIDPKTGHVLGWIDLTGILPQADWVQGHTDVLNGIAYDAKGDRLFVTGKNWPKLFQITLTPPR